MKKKLLNVMSVLLLAGTTAFAQSVIPSHISTSVQKAQKGQAVPHQRTCASHEVFQEQLKNDPNAASRLQEIANAQAGNTNSNERQQSVTVTIPVVVHVVYRTTAENVSLAQIQSQIDILNKDFGTLNADTSLIPTAFKPLLGRPNIQFCLAQRDPAGNAHTGVIRKSTTVTSWSTNDNVKFTSQGGSNAWDASKYLNLWVCNMGGGILGYAQFPGGPANTDGVVIGYTCFGSTGTAQSPFNKGRTATHEVGHWAGLYHIWADDGGGCTQDDGISDTPKQKSENYNCPTYPSTIERCSTSDPSSMFMNYMDYVNDACMYMFSAGQATAMNNVLNGSRASLKTSNGCVPVGGVVAPVANFSANVTTINAGQSVNFTDLSTNSPTSWAWSFTGGTPSSSSSQNPSNITYNTAGTYAVTLTATNASGSDAETKSAYIIVNAQATSGCDTITNLTGDDTLTVYGSGGWGYIAGHNDYGDIGKAEKFTSYPAGFKIEKAIIYFAKARSNSSTKTFNVRVWDDNGTGGLPNTVLATKAVTYSSITADVNAGNPILVTFTSPVSVTGPFYLGVDYTYAAGDTLGLVTNQDGETTPPTAYEKWSDNSWHSFNDGTSATWQMDLSLAIWPILCATPTGQDVAIANNVITVFPNPSNGLVYINTGKTDNLELKVINALGQTVLHKTDKANASTPVSLDMSSLPNGIYFVNITTGNETIVRRINIAH